MCSLGKGWRLVEKNFGVKIVACQFEPMLRVKCVICAISSTKQNFAHLPLIDPAISFELCQADWVAQTNRARFSKTHPVFTQVSKPKKNTHHLYSYKNNQVLLIYGNSTLCINNTLQRSDCCLHPMPSSV